VGGSSRLFTLGAAPLRTKKKPFCPRVDRDRVATLHFGLRLPIRGDGRIVVTAAKKFKARGRGVDFNPKRIEEAKQNAREAGVSDRVEFVQGDFFEADIHEATVVTLYLLPSVNLKLRPKLLRDLKVGSRIVSHSFDMGDWEPDKTVNDEGRILRFWTVTDKAKAAYDGK
jgi:Methyltransferase domain